MFHKIHLRSHDCWTLVLTVQLLAVMAVPVLTVPLLGLMTAPAVAVSLLAVVTVPVLTVMAVPEPYSINVVVLQDTGSSDLTFGYEQSMPAITYAEEVVKRTYGAFVNFTFIYTNTSCDGDGTAAQAAELHCEHTIGVFIGPACSAALDSLRPLSKTWKIPIITPVGSGISDPSLYKLVTKLSTFSVRSYAKALVAMLTKYKWYNLAIIYDENWAEAVTFKDGLVRVIGNSYLFDQKTYRFNGSGHTSEKLSSVLRDASDDARVYILACQSQESRALMLQAYYLGYATSGEYVFFIIDELSKIPDTSYWKLGQPDDQLVLKALGHAIWPYIDVFWQVNEDFKERMVNRSLVDYGYDYNGTAPSPYIASYYEAVNFYAEVLNETLASGGDPLNGINITRGLWNRTFAGVNGPVRINSEGYRQNNVTFSSFNMKTGLLEPGAKFDYEMGMVDDKSHVSFDWPYNNGVPPLNEPKCGFRGTRCVDNGLSSTMIATIAGLLALIGVTGLIGAILTYRCWKIKHNADLWWWKINCNDLMLTAKSEFSSMNLTNSKVSLRIEGTINEKCLTTRIAESSMAVWKTVGLIRLPLKQLTITKAVLVEFKQLRDVSDSNLARVFGACLEDNIKVLVTEYCIKGSLQDLLGNTNITLDAQFKSSLSRDIINGLCYLHQSPIHQHGRLNSNVCLIDNRFSVKLTDFGLPTLYSNILLDLKSDKFKNECKWKAPEILRSGAASTGTTEADIYSYGMILLEIITQDGPFTADNAYMTTDEIIKKIQEGGNPPFRPAMELPVAMTDLKELIQSCWTENPKSRPSCQSVKSSIKRISAALGDSGNLMENLMRRMELYANNLEKMVEEKTSELREEKKKSEELLYQILPRSVADRLKSGRRVDPQAYEEVSIYFSDIVGFTEISAVSSPMEVVDLLNDIYSCFDAIVEEFDVYKVETIGDAYMVVSGLPQRNGNLHALNIARMSIKVLEQIREFKIRHMPTESVQIRIGLHSGPVCAGVVGSKMPRYCLFGDTVNTASRMESSGKAMMIHISPTIKTLLDQFGSFHMLPRGPITVKGKGEMFTYWLQTLHGEPGDPANSETSQ